MEVKNEKESGAVDDGKKKEVVGVEVNLGTPRNEKDLVTPPSPIASASTNLPTQSLIPREGNMFSSPHSYRRM